MIFKKITAALSAMAVSAGMLTSLPMAQSTAAMDVNYAEALQKSLFFYEVQQSGILPEWNSVPWRADSMINEEGVETDIIPGGWFDAGDHFKFTLTNAYSASVLAWGYIQYKDAVDKAGLGEVYRNNVQWGLDYVMQADRGDKIIGTIGDFTGGSTDHNIWCSAEVYLRKHHLNNGDWERPYDEIADSTTIALCAAALAQGYIIFKDDQPDKAAAYLAQAKKYFETADKIRDNENGAMGTMYNPSSWVDDCMYAANWLYMATGDESYLKKCESDYIPNFPTESQSTDWKYTWGFCWDDTTQAAALLYAINTGKQEWIDHISHHLDYWDEGYGGKRVAYTDDGLAYLMNWGPLRHATSTAWIAKLASDTIFKDDAALSKKYDEWAKSQMEYCFGDNSTGLCYVLGMGEKNPTAIHHRTASGIHDDHWNELGKESGGAEGWQTEYAHTLYGALIGGPDSKGNYDQSQIGVSNYEYTEVAIDYNAGYTAALCAMIDDYGGTKLADFPPRETPTWDEWKVGAVLNGKGDSYTEIKAWAMNHTAWPARVQKDISYRYFFDVSELIEAGYSIDILKVEGKSQQYKEGEQGYAEVSGPYKYEGDPSGNTYYAEIKFLDGRAIQPTGQSEHRDEVQFRVSIPDAIDGKSTKGAWDPTNDFSYEGVTATDSLKNPASYNKHIPMYINGVLVWGEEPDGTKAVPGADLGEEQQPTTGSTEPSQTETTQGGIAAKVWGDSNCDEAVNLADAILIMQAKANPSKYELSEQGAANADVYKTGDGITNGDALSIQRYLLGLVESLPEK
ncbi:MAG: glycoside hydrolase [Ruminococcus sp.]|nr:glycoside hydrolase [Ruminococcus sp.]